MTAIFIICTVIMVICVAIYTAVYVRDRRVTLRAGDELKRLNAAWEHRLAEIEAGAAALRAALLECRESIAHEADRAARDPQQGDYAAYYRDWLRRIDDALADPAGADLLRSHQRMAEALEEIARDRGSGAESERNTREQLATVNAPGSGRGQRAG
jgi:hypothetical protein